ncbi:hypothetical protein Alches_17500 [Alicyclobacillus hesperidum subsp. aegles]|uniref:hypothetical protein n=1 Tax=Alicyclobacillus hesperidum TaxID=89784 RepID=UPI00222CA210|nr:hypothetical protein [Alicyclobacillus hesperidum]GLG01710.1 hypothetical protein Alches_17500 [Alicyclobacillus hesperidum subsp. aegles]
MGNRRRGKRKKGSRGNGNRSTGTQTTTISVPDVPVPAPAPVSSDIWDGVTVADVRDLVHRYGHWGLRFPAKVVIKLLDEIERLEGQACTSSMLDNPSSSARTPSTR